MAFTFGMNVNPDGNLTRSLGSTSAKWKLNGYVAEMIAVSVTATSSTSTTISNSNITAQHIVVNQHWIHGADISYTTSAGSITITCDSGIPAMTLYLAVKA